MSFTTFRDKIFADEKEHRTTERTNRENVKIDWTIFVMTSMEQQRTKEKMFLCVNNFQPESASLIETSCVVAVPLRGTGIPVKNFRSGAPPIPPDLADM